MTVAAYAFAARNVDVSDKQTSASSRTSDYLQVFATGADCRKVMASASPAVQVVISEEIADVAPMNLLAALHQDESQRDIYLLAPQHSAALASKVRAAGGRGIIDQEQLSCMVGVAQPEPVASLCAPVKEAVVACPLPVAPVQPAPPVLVEEPLRPPIEESRSILSFIEQSSKGNAIAFVSGRGGVGKSTLTILSALVLQEQGSRVVALDLDLQFGDLAYLAEHVPPQRIQRLELEAVLENPQRLQPSADRLCLITAPERPEQAEDYVGELPEFVKSLKGIADYVLINTGSFWSELQAILAQSVDRLVFLMDQRATSVRGCQQVVDLCIRLQIPSIRFIYALNRYTRNASLTDLDVSMSLGGNDVITIAEAGPLVDEMLSLGTPCELLESEAELRASLELLLAACNATGTPPSNRAMPAMGALTGIFRHRRKGSGRVAP